MSPADRSRADVVFAGGGVIGMASAWLAAREGLKAVVVDPSPGQGASWAAAGMLAPVTEARFGEEDLVRLMVAGAALWGSFAKELSDFTGVDIGYRRCGTVVVAVDASDRAYIDDLLAFQQTLGLESQRLSASECRRLVPALSPALRGGANVPGDHQVNNRILVEALHEACRSAGVRIVHEKALEVKRSTEGAAKGLRLSSGSLLEAGIVVLCAGWETTHVGGLPRGSLPEVRPVKGHILRLLDRSDPPLLERTVRGLVRGRSCYLVPREDGSLVVGATVEERGSDRSVQAGSVHALLDDARALVPGIDELELQECATGLRPGSADNGPHIGWTDVPNLAVATGHYRNGILLTPITARAVVSLLTDDRLADEVLPFGARRSHPGPLEKNEALARSEV